MLQWYFLCKRGLRSQGALPLQGLQSGNYSFQVMAIDAAGNIGEDSPNYLFSVDKSLPMDGIHRASHWGLGWKFWLIVVGGALAVGFVCIAVFSVTLRYWRHSKRSEEGNPASYVPQTSTTVSLLPC